MRCNTLLLTCVVVGYSLSCVSHGDNQLATNSRAQKQITVLRPVPAVLNEETHPEVQGTETKIKGTAGEPYEFTHAQFISENHGWAMSSASLYRTINAGKTWELLPKEPEKDARFTSFFFVDESHGWLTAVKQVSAKRYGLGNSSVIMVTDDGGQSWKEQASFPNEVVLSEIRFLNTSEGIAVGAQVIDDKPAYYELLVVKTSNAGNEWNNISEPAKAAIKNEYGIANDSGRNIQWRPSSMLLLTRYGKVIRTTDGGKTWEFIASFQDKRPDGVISSTGYHKLALDGDQVRVVAGGMGDEGYWGDFVVHEHDRWTSYEIARTPILDAVFVSNNEVLACGLNVVPRDEKRNSHLKNAGVILRSFDSGKSWQPIYRSRSDETFFFLARAKDREFYSVSDTGTFLRFTLPQ
jgi:photosystem II stability/assembly factor-like uncharacterized protein